VGEGLSANLDFLRAIAVLLVLAQHLLRRAHVYQVGWVPTSCLGKFGVLLFFVHTCLVLMYSMQRNGLTGWSLLRNFHIRRIFRIYPLSVVAVLTAVALGLDSDINGIAGLSQASFPGKLTLAGNLLLIQNLVLVKSIVNVLWSLPFELQMYLLLPFFYFWLTRRRNVWPLLALWFVACALAAAQPHIHALQRFSILRFIPNFLPGVIAFTLPRASRFKPYLWPLFIGGIVFAYTSVPTDTMGWSLCLALGFAIPLFQEITSRSVRFIAGRIAKYSYGIYLSHQFCIWVAFGVLDSWNLWLQVLLFIVMACVIPIALYHFIELPMIRLGTRLAKLSEGRRTAVIVLPDNEARQTA
jgi:peptidoglycan/LPS O-acetylase OafA/YrhL